MQRERQIDRLRVCNSFRELVRIAKEWVNEYSEMPVSVRRLFKHTHLNTACRLLGVSSLSLEFLPERDTSLSDSDGERGNEEASKGWTGAAGKKPMVEDLEAARESHAAQNRADAATGAAAAAAAAVEHKGPVSASASAAVNGRKAEVGTPRQVVQVGGEAAGNPGVTAAAAAAAAATTNAASAEGTDGGKSLDMLPFAVLRGPEVEQERWEVRAACVRVFVLLCVRVSLAVSCFMWFGD